MVCVLSGAIATQERECIKWFAIYVSSSGERYAVNVEVGSSSLLHDNKSHTQLTGYNETN